VTGTARHVLLGLGGLAVAAGVLMSIPTGGGGIGLILLGALMVAGVVLEARYGRPGAPTDVPPHAWELTNEKFIDDETGQLLEVWIDPLTGERRYEPAGSDPRLTWRRD
jgi:hypothetical protein